MALSMQTTKQALLMTNDARRDATKRGEQPKKRRGWDRRADRGRRMVRDRRREKVEVAFERRSGVERRAEAPRRARAGRRNSDPEGFQRLNL